MRRPSKRACAGAWLPARLELVGLRPRVLIDAAHNVDSALALADELARWRNRPLWLVLGILRDKDAPAILRVLLPLADGVIVVTPTSPRALPAESLAAACRRISTVRGRAGVVGGRGARSGQAEAGRDGAVAVAGSFATASEARAALGLAEVVTPRRDRRGWRAASSGIDVAGRAAYTSDGVLCARRCRRSPRPRSVQPEHDPAIVKYMNRPVPSTSV